MEIKEMQKLKKELQTAISGNIAVLVEGFKKETGISINYIAIDMLFINSYGEESEYIVGSTKVDLVI